MEPLVIEIFEQRTNIDISVSGDAELVELDIIENTEPITIEIIEEAIPGEPGKSAYQLAVENGYTGTVQDWLASLQGEAGKTAYQVAVEQGFQGSEVDWLQSLVGAEGKSAYEVAVAEGFTGTATQWLQSLRGSDGSSAYELAVQNGFAGTVQDWLNSLQGEEGLSSYEIAVNEGFAGSITQWLESLRGEDGKGLEIDVVDGAIYVRQQGGTWILFATAEELRGQDGKNVELQKTATHIQWRQDGGSWANLVALADIKGDAGPNQVTGQTDTTLTGLLRGNGSKVGVASAFEAHSGVVPALATVARLAYPATLPVGQRDVLVWDTIWQCYFRYVEATASWQQVSVPRHDNTTMNSLPSPEAGYRVFNTTWSVESTYTGVFWQEERRVVKYVQTERTTDVLAIDPELQLILPSGVWDLKVTAIGGRVCPGFFQFALQVPAHQPSSNDWVAGRYHFTSNTVRFLTSATSIIGQVGANNTTTNQISYELIMTVMNTGTFGLQWAQNVINPTASVLLPGSFTIAKRIA